MSKKQILVFGKKAVLDTLLSQNIEIAAINKQISTAEQQQLIDAFKSHGVPYEMLNLQDITKSFGYVPDGVEAVAIVSKIKFVDYNELFDQALNATDKLPLIVALDGVRNPGNVGTIIRSLDAADAIGLISDNTCVIRNNRLMRNASAGAIFHLPIVRTFNLIEILNQAKRRGIQIFASSSHDLPKKAGLFEIDLLKPTIIVLGSEEHGIRQEIVDLSDKIVQIPQKGHVESLNVGVAGSIIIYQALRQKFYSC